MGVSAIIVTYNRLSLLRNCLKYLLAQDYSLDRIFVINNDSSDGTKEYLNNLKDNRIYAKNLHKNIGGSGGFSLGTKLAYEHSNSNYFWLMDDDSAPAKDSLEQLVVSAKQLHNNFGFLCSNVRSTNNVPINVPTVVSNWTELLPGNLIRVKTASFVSLFFSRNIVKTLGLPIGEMFIWGDDCEYTTRISNKYKSYLVSNSIVIHESADSNKGSKEEESIFNTHRINFYECSYRNTLYIDRKYYGIKGVIKRFIGDIKSLIEIPFLSKNKRLKRCYYILMGIIKGFLFNPKIQFPNNK